MKEFTIYFKTATNKFKTKALKNGINIANTVTKLGGKLICKSVHSLTFSHTKRIPKNALPHQEDILAVVDHDAGRNRYRRIRTKARVQPQSLTPMQVAKAYNFPSVNPITLPCVAIVELGGSVTPALINQYCNQMNLIPPHMTNLDIEGAREISDGPDGSDGEVDLDVCIVAAVAQGINILTIFAPNSDQGFCDAVLAAVNHSLNPCAISVSWGSPIDFWPANIRAVMDNAFQSAQAKGINVFVAAGDNGSDDGVGDGQNHVDYPSSSPYAISCGGTELFIDSQGQRLSENVWGKNGATGGGASIMYERPNYQILNYPVSAPLDKTGNQRMVPDIAANASPDTGYIVDVDGEGMAIGGTSAVAPLYAALTAVLTSQIGKRIGNLHQILYRNPEICNDITQGSNGAFKAGPGFDLCTGLGSIDGTKLLAFLQGKPISPAPPVPNIPTCNFVCQAKKFLKWFFSPKQV
jgi:kumamolisin